MSKELPHFQILKKFFYESDAERANKEKTVTFSNTQNLIDKDVERLTLRSIKGV